MPSPTIDRVAAVAPAAIETEAPNIERAPMAPAAPSASITALPRVVVPRPRRSAPTALPKPAATLPPARRAAPPARRRAIAAAPARAAPRARARARVRSYGQQLTGFEWAGYYAQPQVTYQAPAYPTQQYRAQPYAGRAPGQYGW
jgi:hypothetical protein